MLVFPSVMSSERIVTDVADVDSSLLMNGDIAGGDADDNLSDEMSTLADKTATLVEDVPQLYHARQQKDDESPHIDRPVNNAGLLFTSRLC